MDNVFNDFIENLVNECLQGGKVCLSCRKG